MDMGISFTRAMAAAAALAMLAAAAGAQRVSDSYAFLKAVKERDGNKVVELIGEPGTVVINTRERESGDGGLHIVVRDRDANWLTFLLARGARPDIQNKRGDTPLGLAAQLGWTDGAQLLISRRAGVDLPNNNGETPLIMAVQRRDVAMVRLLLSKGADPKRADNVAGYSAIDYARQDPRAAAILKLLETPVAAPKAAAGPTL